MRIRKLARHALVVGMALTLPAWGAGAETIYAPLGDVNQVVRIDAANVKSRRLYSDLQNAHGLAITPDGRTLYSASLLEQIALPESAPGAAAQPAGVSDADHAAHHGGVAASTEAAPRSFSFISRFDAATGKIGSRIDVKNFTHHVTVTPDGAKVIGVQSGAGRIVVIDAKTDTVERFIPVGAAPNYALVSKDGSKVFVSSAGSNAITVLDGRTWSKTASIPVGSAPEHMVFSPDESRIYAVNVGSDELSIVDTQSLKEVARVATGATPHGVGYNSASATVIVTNTGDGTVSIYTAEGKPTQVLPLAPQPYHVAVGESIWISSRERGQIWRLSTQSLAVIDTLEVPGIAHQIVVAQ